jgi:hypothetical protein
VNRVRELLNSWRRLRSLLEEAEHVHDALSRHKDPSIADIVLPLAYKHVIADNPNVKDDAIVGVAGHYLSQRYPELREYVLTTTQRERLAGLRDEIDRLLNDQEPEGV